MSKVKSITIIGRRWFDNSGGNTYFSSNILVNGKVVAEIPFEYGYGDHYICQSFARLEEIGIVEIGRHDNGSRKSYRQYCKDKGIELYTEASEVSKKRDL